MKKERDNTKLQINIIKKHVDRAQDKIHKKDNEANLFLRDVSTFLGKSIGDYNKESSK